MTLKTWLLFLVTESALSLSPGPAVFYVATQGARAGLRQALPAAGGILTANAVYFALSATSLGAVIAASARFFAVAKWLGAGYLIWLGIRALRSSAAAHSLDLDEAPSSTSSRVYVGAVTLQLANPKALLFFLALLPQFIDPQASMLPQMLILAATSMVPEFLILMGYGWLAHRAARSSARFAVSKDLNRWLAKIEGAGMLGCAALVLNFSRKV